MKFSTEAKYCRIYQEDSYHKSPYPCSLNMAPAIKLSPSLSRVRFIDWFFRDIERERKQATKGWRKKLL